MHKDSPLKWFSKKLCLLHAYPEYRGHECTGKLQVKPSWRFRNVTILIILPDEDTIVEEDHAQTSDKEHAEKGSLMLSRSTTQCRPVG